MRKVELLSPARDLAIGMAAVNNGADAVYIGAPAFGARKAAANSLEDIARLTAYAHRFYCRVFVTLNTLLFDHELAEAERMIWQLYEVGVDALIVQDLGILRMNLPPICLHASTQMHNYDLERIKFLDRMGFQRIVLARELSLEQIQRIRKEVKAELEVFIHGALCVSLSGQCYLSHALFDRSANRGECAQPCRMKWSLKDSCEKVIVRDKYLLSLKDLNLSAHIGELIEAGVDSFKIEGRLKDENYVANVTNYYSSLLNEHSEVQRIGSGKVIAAFEASPERSFNRGHSTYFINGRERGLINPHTPKSTGKRIGRVEEVKGNRIRVYAEEEIHNGDGLCYLEGGELKGIRVNRSEGAWLTCNETVRVKPGTELFRNYDHQFVMQLEKAKSVRKIPVSMRVGSKEGHLELWCADGEGNQGYVFSEEVFDRAENPNQRERLLQQLMKCGDSDYECEEIEYIGGDLLFVPAAVANALRRKVLDALSDCRERNRVRLVPGMEEKGVPYPGEADWHLNVVNRNAALFYADHGVEAVESGLEKKRIAGRCDLMHTRYCLLYELGHCRKVHPETDWQFPLYLYNDKHRFELAFDCKNCEMRVMRETKGK